MHPYEELPHIASLFRQCKNDNATITTIVERIKKHALYALNVGDNFTDSDFHDLNMGMRFNPENYNDKQKTAIRLIWYCKKAIKQDSNLELDPQTSIEIVRLYGELYYDSYKGKQYGKNPRGNTLSKLIDEIVMGNPDISEAQLLNKLKKYENIRVIVEINNEEIVYSDNSGSLMKPAPISGLKDRLSRAKKKLKSR